jgi:hypothetical protein
MLSNLTIVGYELRRLAQSRKCIYAVLLLAAYAYFASTFGALTHGIYGTAPFSRISYVRFLADVSPMLLAALTLLCTTVYSEEELAVRRILFSAPISSVNYYIIKSLAISVVFLVIATSVIVYSFAFYGWHYGYFQFDDFAMPILVFLVSPVIFVFGLSMAAGRINSKIVYGIVPLILFFGLFCFQLPVWVDLCGNNFITGYFRMLVVNRGSAEMVYYLPTNLILSRWLLAVAGIVLFTMSCRRFTSL